MIQQEIDSSLNYYLITNNDPCFHAIYDEKELREMLIQNINYHGEEWECYDDSYFKAMESNHTSENYKPKQSKKIDELMTWLNKDIEDCNYREPSNYHIQDQAYYNQIRRISSNI